MTTLPAMSEAAFLRQVRELAKLYRWYTYHTHYSVHSERGWPDLALARPPRLILAELKSDKGRTTPMQDMWADVLRRCEGIEYYLWKPADFDAIVEVLR